MTVAIDERLRQANRLVDVMELCERRGVPRAKVLGRERHPRTVAVRHELRQRLRAEGMSYPEIGELLDVDHATVMASCRVRLRVGS